jgi:cytoplasmic tRNA 2-thiolation protein 1
MRPKTGRRICLECFYTTLEEEVHYTIVSNELFKPGDRVALGASGVIIKRINFKGKDSTVIAHIMHHLNKKYNYGLELFLLSIDEGIKGYRDDSLETVKLN